MMTVFPLVVRPVAANASDVSSRDSRVIGSAAACPKDGSMMIR
jgi:hypothetical protein